MDNKMANEIRKLPFLVPPPAKAGNGGGTATESQKQNNPAQTPVDAKPTRSSEPEKIELSMPQALANTHLVIEKDDVTGGYVYKSIDRETGKVVQQFPREEVLRAIANIKKAEGQIIDTKA